MITVMELNPSDFFFLSDNSDNEFASYTVVNKRPHNIFPVYLDLYYLSFDLFNE